MRPPLPSLGWETSSKEVTFTRAPCIAPMFLDPSDATGLVCLVIGKAKHRVIVSLCAFKEVYWDGDNILASFRGTVGLVHKVIVGSPTPLVQVYRTWTYQQYVGAGTASPKPGED